MFFIFLIGAAIAQKWAVLIAGSNTFNNYRHQADIATIANMLVKRGYNPQNIINMQYNDLVNDPENIFKGALYHNLDHENMYNESLITHQGNEITAENIYNILTGKAQISLKSTDEDDVLIYYDDHGDVSLLGIPDGNGQPIFALDLQKAIQEMYDKKMFKNLLFVIEACESGSIIPFIKKVPNTVIITASGPSEPSSSAIYDEQLDNFLSNEFTANFLDAIDENPSGTIIDIFQIVLKRISKSTPHIGGTESLYNLPISQFFGINSQNNFRNAIKKRTPANGIMIPQRQTRKFILEKLAKSHKSEAVRQKSSIELLKIAEEREKLLKTMMCIQSNLLTQNCHWDHVNKDENFREIIKYFFTKYGNVSQDDYDLLSPFHQLCYQYSMIQIKHSIDSTI